ncbi:Sister chromatid cohesion protein 2 [Friedmanniomyces endolithicus]|uniref:Sister chromatid cohesion protein n=1 Tax=Friedmanniomyces endolithicus TaxID=329885 RepID=A0AAN6KCW4_9PEZI|nr:Sister chromatid cohesion protein 2 [Friedmanniomyces endolithicus]KAK0976074.1 Sister chromatid cohesion protein 2 [Friedmanniomyces endolithicus]KAK1033622.1 Sister chromatid cohesion protein 2 [Friedmanniomyces endolithicus]
MNGQTQRHDRGEPSNGTPAPSSGSGRIRVPTVYEALPYTPFSSIIHFSPADSIPPPLAFPTPSTSYFSETPEVIDARQTLEHLSAGASSAEHASERCQQTLRDVLKLLDRQSLTQVNFKVTKGSSHSRDSGSTEQQKAAPVPQLSPFASMVFNNSNVSYRYLTPESQEPRVSPQVNGHSNIKRIPPTLRLPTPQSRATPTGYLPTIHLTPDADKPPGGSQSSRLQAVVVSNHLTPAQRAEYQYISETGHPAGVQDATPSRTHDGAFLNAHRSVSVDQKQKGDLAVQGLQALLSDIFDAEDRVHSEGLEAASAEKHALLMARETENGVRLVLQPPVQARLDSGVQKVVSNGRLESIDTDSLMRIQKLCENAVLEIETMSLQVGEEWSEQDAEEWVQRIALAEGGITAARTLMRIMGAGAHIKELQSEDYLRAVLSAIRSVLETCIVPVVEDRASKYEKIRGVKEEAPSNPSFVTASLHQVQLRTLLHATTKTLRVLGDFLVMSQLDESSLSSVESCCTLLIFTENASTERDSVLGIQNFETTRRCAMDVLAKDFAKYTLQRMSIFDALLMSLDKLPAAKLSARQYRLPDSKPIQLVSALLMRLVQTSATHAGESTMGGSKANDDDESDAGAESELSDEADDDEDVSKVSAKKQTPGQPAGLLSLVRPLHDAAQNNASYIVKVLLHRAASSSKSSDEPYRKLIDIFTEDFLNVLPSSDWPSAEMLLRTLVLCLIGMVEGTKSTSSVCTLTLGLLGTIAAGILNLQSTARSTGRSLDLDECERSKHLADLVEQLETGDVDKSSLVAFDGPYHSVIEYLQSRDLGDAQLRSAHGYHIMQWASLLCGGREGFVDSDSGGTPKASKDLQSNLRHMLLDLQWLENNHDYPTVSASQARLATMVLTLSSKLCMTFNKILSVLLTAMRSDQPKVKSRAMKSIVMLLEKDPSILDRNAHVLHSIDSCAGDASPLVRDSALMLLADCVRLRPHLDKVVYVRVIERTGDASIGVRKRCLKFLRDIYLGNESVKMRSGIAQAVITRLKDSEETVSELARQIMEEIWFLPFVGRTLDGDNAVDAKLGYSAQASLLIQTVQVGEAIGPVLESLITQLITKSKTPAAHTAVCRNLVGILFGGIIDPTELAGSPEQGPILRCLAVFARACPTVFTAPQLELLEPYTQSLAMQDDMDIYRSAVVILRHVLPHQSTLNDTCLQTLQGSLLSSVPKLSKSELQVVVPCLWTIDSMLGNRDRLVNFISSALKGVYAMRSTSFVEQPQSVSKASRLLIIVGHFGKACDFEAHLTKFKELFAWYKGTSVAGLFADVLCPFTTLKQPLSIRQPSLEAVCMISQSSPKLLLRQDVVKAFETVLSGHDATLEETLLVGLEGFFSAGELNESSGDVPEIGSGVASGNERLGKTYVATDQDGASTSIARRFLSDILRVALSANGELSFVASKIIVSVNRQGLIHPKESGPALVALETNPNSIIANMAYVEHKAQHTKHESFFDKEYMRAVQQVFEYQRDTIGSTAGYIGQPPASKMHLLWDVLKSGKAQVREKFLSNLAGKLDFDLATLNVANVIPTHLSFVRFCTENLSLFEYDRVDEVVHLLAAMEKTFSVTGTSVAQVIESEVLRLGVDDVIGTQSAADATSETMGPETSPPILDPGRLLQLAVAAQICSLIWESRSFIRRLWNVKKYLDKPKTAAKESNRAAARVGNAASLTEAYLARVTAIMGANASSDAQRQTCAAFVDLVSTDNEVRVGSEEEEDVELQNGYDTPSEGASRKSLSLPPSGGGRGRKRKSEGASATPRKKGRPSTKGRKSGSLKKDEHGEGEWE